MDLLELLGRFPQGWSVFNSGDKEVFPVQWVPGFPVRRVEDLTKSLLGDIDCAGVDINVSSFSLRTALVSHRGSFGLRCPLPFLSGDLWKELHFSGSNGKFQGSIPGGKMLFDGSFKSSTVEVLGVAVEEPTAACFSGGLDGSDSGIDGADSHVAFRSDGIGEVLCWLVVQDAHPDSESSRLIQSVGEPEAGAHGFE